MIKDEFILITNPNYILGGIGADDGTPTDDEDEEEKTDERSGWTKFWDWALGRNNKE